MALITPEPAGETPTTGCYIFLKIYKNPAKWNPAIKELIADAYYKKTIDSPFNKQLQQIRVKPLFNKHSTHWDLMDYNNCSEKLINTVVQIDKIEKIQEIGYMTYAMKWKPIEIFKEVELIKMFPDYYPLPVAVDPLSRFGTDIGLDQISGNIDDEFDDYE